MLQVNMAGRALSNADYLQGSQDSNLRPSCDLKDATDNAAATIAGLAKGGNVDKVITRILSASITELQQYVMMQREVPEKNIGPLSFQAALLRMRDIATVAGAIGCSDYDALCQMQCDENNILARELPQANEVLSPQIQACLGYIMDEIIAAHTKAGGSGTLADVLKLINNSYSYFDKANGPAYSCMTGPEYYSDNANIDMYPIIGGDSTDIYTPQPGPGPLPDSGLGSGGILQGPVVPKTIDPNAIGSVPGDITNEPGTGTSNTTGNGGVLDFLKNALGFVTDATGGIAAAASTLGNAVQGTANDVTTNAVKTAIMKNLPLIIGVVVLLVAIVLIIIYVAKSKNK